MYSSRKADLTSSDDATKAKAIADLMAQYCRENGYTMKGSTFGGGFYDSKGVSIPEDEFMLKFTGKIAENADYDGDLYRALGDTGGSIDFGFKIRNDIKQMAAENLQANIDATWKEDFEAFSKKELGSLNQALTDDDYVDYTVKKSIQNSVANVYETGAMFFGNVINGMGQALGIIKKNDNSDELYEVDKKIGPITIYKSKEKIITYKDIVEGTSKLTVEQQKDFEKWLAKREKNESVTPIINKSKQNTTPLEQWLNETKPKEELGAVRAYKQEPTAFQQLWAEMVQKTSGRGAIDESPLGQRVKETENKVSGWVKKFADGLRIDIETIATGYGMVALTGAAFSTASSLHSGAEGLVNPSVGNINDPTIAQKLANARNITPSDSAALAPVSNSLALANAGSLPISSGLVSLIQNATATGLIGDIAHKLLPATGATISNDLATTPVAPVELPSIRSILQSNPIIKALLEGEKVKTISQNNSIPEWNRDKFFGFMLQFRTRDDDFEFCDVIRDFFNSKGMSNVNKIISGVRSKIEHIKESEEWAKLVKAVNEKLLPGLVPGMYDPDSDKILLSPRGHTEWPTCT